MSALSEGGKFRARGLPPVHPGDSEAAPPSESALHLMVRLAPLKPVPADRVARVCREIRELASRRFYDVETRYGIVVDVIEPRKLIDGCSVYAP